MRIHVKTVTLLLLAALLVSMCACSGGEKPADVTSAAEVASTTAETSTTNERDLYTEPKVKDFGGYEYRIANTETSPTKMLMLMAPAELDGEALNDAVFNRNKTVEGKYNISIVPYYYKSIDALNKNILAGDDVFDAGAQSSNSMFTYIQKDYYLDLAAVDSFDLSQVWWDQNIIKDLSVFGKTYMITGDIQTSDELYTCTVLYNQKLYEDYGFDAPYDIVTSGKWTLDLFYGMMEDAARDVNGDGLMNENDNWGFITETSVLRMAFSGSGEQFIVYKNGDYSLNTKSEKFSNIVEKAKWFALNPDKVLMPDDGKFAKGTYENVYFRGEAMFMNNQSLFKSGVFNDVSRMRDMESDYGVLPTPKYEESQERYYSTVSTNIDALLVPATVSDAERTCLILDAMAYESKFTLNPVFYDMFISEKLARDKSSREMLDIVFASKVYDLDSVAKISGISDILKKMATTKNDNFTSEWAAKEKAAETKLAEFVKGFKK